MTLIVSPLRDVDTVVRFRKPSHLITLLDPHLMREGPKNFRPDIEPRWRLAALLHDASE